MDIQISAIKDKIIAEVISEAEIVSNELLIVLPEGTQSPQIYLKVLSVGEEVDRIKCGDIIVAHQRAGQDLLIGGKKLLKCIMENEAYGIIKSKEDNK